jgi:hypothetical protein
VASATDPPPEQSPVPVYQAFAQGSGMFGVPVPVQMGPGGVPLPVAPPMNGSSGSTTGPEPPQYSSYAQWAGRPHMWVVPNTPGNLSGKKEEEQQESQIAEASGSGS